MTLDDLASPDYRDVLMRTREKSPHWGSSGHLHGKSVASFASLIGADTALDYGCGVGSIGVALGALAPWLTVREYDPSIPGKDALPAPADLVIFTDVAEHVEPDKIDAVLGHIHDLAIKGAYFHIALAPAKQKLADGRNAHILVQPANWWQRKVAERVWSNIQHKEYGKGLTLWLRK